MMPIPYYIMPQNIYPMTEYTLQSHNTYTHNHTTTPPPPPRPSITTSLSVYLPPSRNAHLKSREREPFRLIVDS